MKKCPICSVTFCLPYEPMSVKCLRCIAAVEREEEARMRLKDKEEESCND